jgi:hypothetical protein
MGLVVAYLAGLKEPIDLEVFVATAQNPHVEPLTALLPIG